MHIDWAFEIHSVINLTCDIASGRNQYELHWYDWQLFDVLTLSLSVSFKDAGEGSRTAEPSAGLLCSHSLHASALAQRLRLWSSLFSPDLLPKESKPWAPWTVCTLLSQTSHCRKGVSSYVLTANVQNCIINQTFHPPVCHFMVSWNLPSCHLWINLQTLRSQMQDLVRLARLYRTL